MTPSATHDSRTPPSEAPRRGDGAFPTPTAPVCIATHRLTKRFPVHQALLEAIRRPFTRHEAVVLRDVSVEIRTGELFGFLGLNGAGKSTLLRLLAGMLHPDGGRIEIAGIDVVAHPAAVHQRLALVTAEERSLNWRLSASENLRLYAGLHGMSRRVADARIRESLEAVDLAGTGGQLVGTFSSGMRQRLLVARALLARPRILLLDEPTRSLDPLSAHAFRQMLRDALIRAQGTTVVLATHNTEEAFTYCNRVAVLHRGSIAAIGSAAELAARFIPDRYRVCTPAHAHPVFDRLEHAGRIGAVLRPPADAPDPAVICDLPGGEPAAAQVLCTLVEAGIPVHRFERVPLALSDLIARIAAAHDAAAPEGAATHA